MTDYDLTRANERIAELESQNAALQAANNRYLDRARRAEQLVNALRNQAPLSSAFDGVDISKLRQETAL